MKVSSSGPEGSFPKVVGYLVVGFAVAVLAGVLLTAAVMAFSSPARADQPSPALTHMVR